MQVMLDFTKAARLQIGRHLLTRARPVLDLANLDLTAQDRVRIDRALQAGLLIRTQHGSFCLPGVGEIGAIKEVEGDRVRVTFRQAADGRPASVVVHGDEARPPRPDLILFED